MTKLSINYRTNPDYDTDDSPVPEKGEPLIVATGDAAKYWSKGAGFETDYASVFADKYPMPLAQIFKPTWPGTQATVVVSEFWDRVTEKARENYVDTILSKLKPSSVVLLDSYHTSEPTESAPLQYISSSGEDPFDGEASPLSTSLEGTSAVFYQYLSKKKIPVSALLLPSPHESAPAPEPFQPRGLDGFDEIPVRWDEETIKKVQGLLFRPFGESVEHEWKLDEE